MNNLYTTSNDFVNLSTLNTINPARNRSFRKQQRVLLQEFNIVLHALLQVSKLQEVSDSIDGGVGAVRVFDDLAELIGVEGQHATVSVVEENDFACSEESLGDYDATESFFTVCIVRDLVWEKEGMETYAEPPALRTT